MPGLAALIALASLASPGPLSTDLPQVTLSQAPMTASAEIDQIAVSPAAGDASFVRSSVVELFQPGRGDMFSLTQTGDDDQAHALQSGTNDMVALTQSGPGDEARLTQSGSDDMLRLIQSGRSDLAIVTQTGTNDLADIVQQSGFDTLRLMQGGIGDIAIIRQ